MSARLRQLFLSVVVAALAVACGGDARSDRDATSQDLVVVGERAIRDHGCGSCHTIAGVSGATGTTGPPLVDVSKQVYIAGVLANTPENLERWLLDPRDVDPRTAMPDTGLTRAEAMAIRAYLYERTG